MATSTAQNIKKKLGISPTKTADEIKSTGTFTANGATPVTVADTNFTATSFVTFQLDTVGGTVGAYPAIKTVTPGTGFTVGCTASDTSVYRYKINA
jgi:hypothetical protein